MKAPVPSGLVSWATFVVVATIGITPTCRASHYDVINETNQAPIQCLVQDLRHPAWTKGHYLACYSQYFQTREGWGGYFYGGFVGDSPAMKGLLQFCSWQMGGKGAPSADIDFCYAGRHMSWAKTTWEGCAGGIKGHWPVTELKQNEWHRFVARTWAPLDDPAHSFIGIWMKDMTSGVWNHLATTRYPGTIVNLSAFFGFQENFAGGRADAVASLHIRNTYSQRGGKWVADNKCLFRPQGNGDKKERLCLKAIENGTALSLQTLWAYVDKATPGQKADQAFVPEKRSLAYRLPERPMFFDPVKLKSLAAASNGSQLYVKWDLAAESCPQLSYKLEIFDNAQATGTPVQVLHGNDPEARTLLLDLNGCRTPYARLTLTDIYGNTGAPVTCAAAPVTLTQASAKPEPFTSGLNYRYYEAPDKTDWMAIPDFTKLTPVRTGAIGEPNLNPRLRRTNYAFEFTGQIEVAQAGIYDFTLVYASGVKLLIDERVVVNGDGYHSVGNTSGAIAMAAGKHALSLQYVQGPKQLQQADDYLQILWSTPGTNGRPARIPAVAFSRKPGPNEPKITIVPPASATGNRVKLASTIANLQGTAEGIEYYSFNPDFDYFRAQGARGGEYQIGATKNTGMPLETILWNAPQKIIRARLLYGGNRTIDSEPVTFKSRIQKNDPWTLSELEHHQYPVATELNSNSITLVGESMSLLTQPVSGDCTLMAHLVDITALKESQWQAGIILRNDLEPSPGEPLGGKTTYAALIGCADETIRDCDSLMINGAGNQPSGNRGRNKRWMKLQRTGNDITESLSEDGKTWTVNKTVSLPKLSKTIHAGLFIYALPSEALHLHQATFNNVSLSAGSPQ